VATGGTAWASATTAAATTRAARRKRSLAMISDAYKHSNESEGEIESRMYVKGLKLQVVMMRGRERLGLYT
jgi:hypothetical protein